MAHVEQKPVARRATIPVILGVLAVAAIAALLWAKGVYNGLVTLDEKVNSSWAQVDTVLQRRYDLIPNLVNTVKGYAAHEKEVLERVTELRSQWGNAKSVAEKADAATQLESALGRLMVVVEKYPDLKADQGFRDLQVELAGTENRIAVERQRYNESVRQFNSEARRFPANLIASFAGLQARDAYFKVDEPAKKAPTVDFSK